MQLGEVGTAAHRAVGLGGPWAGLKNLTQLAACSWKRNGGKARAAVFHFLVRKTITIPNGLSLFPVKTIPALVGKNL